MVTHLLEQVKKTRKTLRQQIIAAVLNQFDEQSMKLDRSMRQEKYRKMMGNPFRFYRGSAYLFYYDVTNVPFSFHTPEDKPTWIQGDLHFENFGAFQNEQGHIVYDVNDFDEGYMGSYLYDILRMTTSIALFCEGQGLGEDEQTENIAAYVAAYYKQLLRFERKKEDPVTLFFTKDNTEGPIRKVLKKLEKRQASEWLEGITSVGEDSRRCFVLTDEIQPVSNEERAVLEQVWTEYMESLDVEDRRAHEFYRIKDIAHKHGSGTASIGLARYYVLIEGDGQGELDDLVLEVKEVRTPIPAYFLPYNEGFWQRHSHQGERVITTQKAMHHHEDPYLGFITIGDRHFYVRERSPFKKRVKAKHLTDVKEINSTVEIMGRITAKIHARADTDVQRDLLSYHSEEEILRAIGGDFEAFCAQIIFWSMMYKQQVKEDYVLFCDWCREEFDI
ncbi:uncharacterized protein (DUF2252 family) [Aneurinibacillus soli]|uniref:Uncharacterized protein n=1 Tax=Aneurinibacillus soli TaxID=1500254 RepID=A0A0U5BDY3_9BACL|nr:DUF2252 family protein [Aneurinibacillus soli]PYE61247.1 uncharacterized protein (DUF2252 family) [Aneurinibacillus soli]BAU26318.1 hypothetical protein CB4_00432 [Aneurinibacillus soli]